MRLINWFPRTPYGLRFYLLSFWTRQRFAIRCKCIMLWSTRLLSYLWCIRRSVVDYQTQGNIWVQSCSFFYTLFCKLYHIDVWKNCKQIDKHSKVYHNGMLNEKYLVFENKYASNPEFMVTKVKIKQYNLPKSSTSAPVEQSTAIRIVLTIRHVIRLQERECIAIKNINNVY
jgi:hypothetical protein